MRQKKTFVRITKIGMMTAAVDGACPFTGVFTDCTFFDAVKDFITEAKNPKTVGMIVKSFLGSWQARLTTR